MSGHHEPVGERQGRQPAQDIWRDPAAARERLRASSAAQTYRTIMVAGSRSVRDANAVNQVLDHTFRPGDRLIHGAAAGADTLAGAWASVYGVPTLKFRPEYELHGKAAPHVRNDAMLGRADLVVAFWDGKSKGTKSVIDKARERGIPLVVTNL